MKVLFDLLKIFIATSKMKISRSMQYRIDFITGLFVSFLLSFMGPLFQYLIFQKSSGYANWNTSQILLYQGIMVLWFGIKDSLFGETRSFIEQTCRSGQFDMLLLKPYPPIGIIFTRGYNYQSMPVIAVGLAIVVVSVIRMSLAITVRDCLVFVLFFLAGQVFYMAIMVFYCSITVKIVYTFRLSEILDKFLVFSHFPTDIYTRGMRIVFFVIAPIALWIYFPAQTLLHRLNNFIFPSIFASFAIFGLSLLIWKSTLKKYTSAGG